MAKNQLTPSNSLSVQDFLKKSEQLVTRNKEESGRLLFAMDATASRERSWDMAWQFRNIFMLFSRIPGISCTGLE